MNRHARKPQVPAPDLAAPDLAAADRAGVLSRRGFLSGAGGALVTGVAAPGLLFGAARTSRTAGPARAATAAAFPKPVFTTAGQAAALQALGRTTLRQPGSLPFPHLRPGTDTLPGIEHIVVLMMENHSYDNIFGMLGRGNGFTLGAGGLPTATNPYANGQLQHAFRMPTTCQLDGRPSQEWLTGHTAYDNGAMDGFVRAPTGPYTTDTVGGVAMGYWTGDDIPFTYSLAETFTVGDRWFCSVMGQTLPNRRYVTAGTSAGMTDDGGASLLALAIPVKATIYNLLDSYNISWENYVTTYPTSATPDLYPLDDAIPEAFHHTSFDDFFSAASSGNLPAYSFLDENFDTQSEEDPQNIVVGEAMIAQVVDAIASGPLWKNTLLAIMYDEHGGYYDHVPPPPAIPPDDIPPIVQPGEQLYDGFARYGFRVPSVVVSAYAKPGAVTSVLHDHTSVLAMIERKWNLPALTYRDANANDLTDFLDLSALAAGQPTFPSLPTLAPPGDTSSRLACSSTGPGTIPPPGSITG
jgi:phospholipase C